VHTIGFAVDVAAKYQLQCIARVARGRYFDADSAGKLATALGEAAKPAPPPPPPQQTTQIVITKPKPGKLVIRNAEMSGHKVSKAEGGDVVATLNSSGPSAELPAGLYNVAFGRTVWKSVEVRPGETTTLDPGIIEIRNPSISGHKVLDNETREEIGSIMSSNPTLAVLPSTFAVTFGKALWKDIEVKEGERKILNPGVVKVEGAGIPGYPIKDEDGNIVAQVSATQNTAPLPPGKYTLDIAGQQVPLDLTEGQTIEVKAQ
jgi:hypothetical protein